MKIFIVIAITYSVSISVITLDFTDIDLTAFYLQVPISCSSWNTVNIHECSNTCIIINGVMKLLLLLESLILLSLNPEHGCVKCFFVMHAAACYR